MQLVVIQFYIYEKLKEKYDNKFQNIVLFSFISKTISSTITYPIDVVRTVVRNSKEKDSIKIIKDFVKSKKKCKMSVLTLTREK